MASTDLAGIDKFSIMRCVVEQLFIGQIVIHDYLRLLEAFNTA
jgi:hypothetical protein